MKEFVKPPEIAPEDSWHNAPGEKRQKMMKFEFLISEFGQNSVGIQKISARIHWKFSILGIAHHSLEDLAKFREILIKICAKVDEKRRKIAIFCIILGKNPKKFHEILLKF